MYFYEKLSGSYYLKDDMSKENVLSRMDHVSVLYDAEHHVLLKHGNPKAVDAYACIMRSKFAEVNESLPDEAKMGTNFKVITSNRWKEKELNWMLQCSGYVGYLETDSDRFFE